MKKIDSENLYLVISIISAILLPFSLSKTNNDSSVFGNSFLNIWLPFWLLVLFLPFYGITQIVKRTDDWNIKFWIGLLLNMLNFIFFLRFFGMEILPN